MSKKVKDTRTNTNNYNNNEITSQKILSKKNTHKLKFTHIHKKLLKSKYKMNCLRQI